MLATRLEDPRYIAEPKLDGQRVQVSTYPFMGSTRAPAVMKSSRDVVPVVRRAGPVSRA